MRITAQDQLFAERMLSRVHENDASALAQLLAEYREVVISCTVARLEREFVRKKK